MNKTKHLKKVAVIALVLSLILASTVGAFAKSVSFSDVRSVAWYAEPINTLVAKGVMSGYADGTFRPNNGISVAEFVKTTVVLLAGEQSPVPGDPHWASGYMHAASNTLQIIPDGMFTRGDWNKDIKREQIAVILEKAARWRGETATVGADEINRITSLLKDTTKISPKYVDDVLQAVGRGLISGYTDGNFKPQYYATRAEAASMLVRLLDTSKRVYPSAPPTGKIIASGTDIRDIIKDPKMIDYYTSPEQIFPVTKYVVYENGDQFSMSLFSIHNGVFIVQYKGLWSKIEWYDKNGMMGGYDVVFGDPEVLTRHYLPGNVNDVKYLAYTEFNDDSPTSYDQTMYFIPFEPILQQYQGE